LELGKLWKEAGFGWGGLGREKWGKNMKKKGRKTAMFSKKERKPGKERA
jgi:hypothetical protein